MAKVNAASVSASRVVVWSWKPPVFLLVSCPRMLGVLVLLFCARVVRRGVPWAGARTLTPT